MGRTGVGRWRTTARLQHSDSGRKENHVDGSRTGQRGHTEVQHKRFTGLWIRDETRTIMVSTFSVTFYCNSIKYLLYI